MTNLFSLRAAIVSVLIAGAMLARPVPCRAQITVGHVDDFQDGTTQGWLGASVEAVANAGPDGAGDTALGASATGFHGPSGKLIVYNAGDRWTGNWTTAGVAQISLDVRNPNAFPLTMRLAIAGPGGFGGGGGGDTHVTDGIPVAGDNAWHSITFDVLADNFTPLDLITYPDVATALAGVTHFRVLHNHELGFVGATVDADFLIDNIRTIGATVMVPGDYNRNGAVDAADYVVWRKMLNQMVTPGSGADGTGPSGEPDGVVNTLDYDFWRSQFGSPAPGSSAAAVAVPEPSALAVVLGFMPALLGRRRSLRLSR